MLLNLLAPEWRTLGPIRRLLELAVLPLAWGVVCGVLLGVSAPLYLAGSAIAAIGGVFGGAQHATQRGAMLRAAAGGTFFGLANLLGYAFTGGDHAVVMIPDPAALLLAFTIIPAFPLHYAGWRLAAARRATEIPA
jgi:hypothetical protein